MVTKSTDKSAAAAASQATATAFAAPTTPSGPAAGIPAGDAAKLLAQQPAPQGMTSSGERAIAATETETAAMAIAAQDQVERAKETEAAKGEAAAAEIAALATPTAPLEDPAATVPPAGDPAALLQPGDPLLPTPAVENPAAMPAVTGAGPEGIQTKSGHLFTGELATLWTKLKAGATEAELRTASGVHDVVSHLRRWEATGVARITSRSAEGGIVYQAKEQGEA